MCRLGKWIRVRAESREVEIDRCRFENKTNNLEEVRGCQLMQIYVRNQGERHHVHHNYFVDVPDGKESNGYETLQLITEGNPYDPEPGDCETVIEYNLFERCNGGGGDYFCEVQWQYASQKYISRLPGGRWCFGMGMAMWVSENFFFGEGERRGGRCAFAGRRIRLL